MWWMGVFMSGEAWVSLIFLKKPLLEERERGLWGREGVEGKNIVI